MSYWFQKKHIADKHHGIMDVKAVCNFIKQTPSNNIRYWIKSEVTRSISHCVVPSTVMQAIKNGHTDTEIWSYANPLFPTTITEYGQTRTIYSNLGRTQSIVIDFDNLVGVDSCEELVSAMRARNVPTPYIIVQTGPHSFHAFYLGHRGDWPKHKQIWLAAKWAQIPVPADADAAFYAAIKKSGIDDDYFSQGYEKSKFRVAGSINTNHIVNGKYWQCVGWVNNSYDYANTQYYEEMAIVDPSVIPDDHVLSIASSPQKKHNFNPNVYRTVVEALVEDKFPRGFGRIRKCDITDLLIENLTWLMNGQFRLHQVSWAKRWGVDQPEVSRLIKTLKGFEILITTQDWYIQGQRSKVYGAGDVLREVVGWYGRTVAQPEWMRWDDGTANYRMLYDIRYFISMGYSVVDTITKLHERQAHRPHRKQRSTRDFQRAIEAHINFLQENNRMQKDAMLIGDMAIWDSVV